MTTRTSCSWCHTGNAVTDHWCRNCEHAAHRPRTDCDCARCRPQQPTDATRYHQRITWIDGRPHVQRCPVEIVLCRSSTGGRVRFGDYERDGEVVRPATEADLRAMRDGQMAYDPDTEPSALAWAAHVARGGD